MAEVFKALGDPNRLMMIKILASSMEKSVYVIGLAELLGISQPAASQHLRVLKNVGILEPRREGVRVYYSINTEVLRNYKESIDMLFEMAFSRCGVDGDCENCRYHDKCLEVTQ